MERRRFKRLKTRVPLYGRAVAGLAAVEGLVMNIGEGGFSFESPSELPLFERYEFDVTPPEGAFPTDKLSIVAQVRWCTPSQESDGHYWIGVMFEPAGAAQWGHIRKFVNDYTLPEG